ncbi:MAG: WbqC family protein [Bacteroidales bacterium]|nr:WbqC family protein [Bacteroidales bacterium]
MNNTVILSTAYLPPIQYFSKLLSYPEVLIEAQESYSKQSYRNRCEILSCNGLLSLTIPVVKVNGNNTLTKDIEIDYSTNWQKNHWKAIESAYRTSAYYDFVADLINPYFSKKEKYLIDLNAKIILEVMEFLGVSKSITNTGEFVNEYSKDVADFRSSIHPKSQFQTVDNEFKAIKYFQVFNDRFSFFPNLSVIDLLFNEGLNSLKILQDSSIKKPTRPFQ